MTRDADFRAMLQQRVKESLDRVNDLYQAAAEAEVEHHAWNEVLAAFDQRFPPEEAQESSSPNELPHVLNPIQAGRSLLPKSLLVSTPTRAVESFVSALPPGTLFKRSQIAEYAAKHGAPGYDKTAINNALNKLRVDGIVSIEKDGTARTMAVWKKM